MPAWLRTGIIIILVLLPPFVAAHLVLLTSKTEEVVISNSVIMVHPHEEDVEETAGKGRTSVFLAGTIDMGLGADWQQSADSLFRSLGAGQWLLYNPRQKNWDPSIPGEMDYQVTWELEQLEKADFILMNFLGGSHSPITLLELGLYARSGKLVVVCPEEFYRYDNVRITCEKYGVVMLSSLNEAVQYIETQK